MPIPPTRKSPVVAMRENLAALRQQGADTRAQQAEIARWIPKIQAFNKTERARELSAASNEERSGVLSGVESFTEGATLGGSGLVGDALAAALDREMSFGDVRAARRGREAGFREAHPVTDFGLSVAGGALTPTMLWAKIAKPGAGLVRKGVALAAEGAAQAGVEGALRGTDDFSGDAIERALAAGARQAVIGGVASPAVAGVTNAGVRAVRSGAQRVTGAAGSRGVRTLARQLGEEGAALTDEAADALASPRVMAADVLKGGPRALRASTNIVPDAEEMARGRLRVRDADVVTRSDAAVREASGMAPEDVASSVREMTEARARKARPLYDKALEAGDIAPERTARTARAAAAAERGRFDNLSDVELEDEYTRLLEAQNLDEGRIAGLEDSPEFSEHMEMPGLKEDQRGVTIGDRTVGERNREVALERGRVQSRQRSLDAMRAELDRRAGQAGPAFLDEVDDEAALGFDALLESPIMRRAIRQAKALPQYAKLPDTDMRVMDKAYKNVGGKAQKAKRSGDNVAAHDLGTVRSALRRELVERNPAYGKALEQFSDDSALIDAYGEGVQAFGRRPGEVTEAMRGLSPAERDLFKRGVLDAMREDIGKGANVDLGAAAPKSARAGQVPIASENAARVLREVFGEEGYRKLLKARKVEGRFAHTSNEMQGNSSTAKQLRDMGAFGVLGDDVPMTMTGIAAKGAKEGWKRTRRAFNTPGHREAADLLTREGSDEVEKLLEALRAEFARGQGNRAAARSAGLRVGQSAPRAVMR